MAKRKALLSNPLDEDRTEFRHALDVAEEQPQGIQSPQQLQQPKEPQQPHQPPIPTKPKRTRDRFTVHVDTALTDRVKDAVYWTHRDTLAAFAERAFAAELARMEEERGGPFPKRDGDLPTGRPVR